MTDPAPSGLVAGGGAGAVGVPHGADGARPVGGAAAVPRSVNSVQPAEVDAGDPLDAAVGDGVLRSPRVVGWG